MSTGGSKGDRKGKPKDGKRKVNRLTVAQREMAVMACRVMLDRRKTDWEIKRRIAAVFKVSTRTVERYLRHARLQLRGESDQSVEEHRVDAYTVYAGAIRSRRSTPRDRVKAQAEICKLYGLNKAPVQRGITASITKEQLENMSLDELSNMYEKLGT